MAAEKARLDSIGAAAAVAWAGKIIFPLLREWDIPLWSGPAALLVQMAVAAILYPLSLCKEAEELMVVREAVMLGMAEVMVVLQIPARFQEVVAQVATQVMEEVRLILQLPQPQVLLDLAEEVVAVVLGIPQLEVVWEY